MDYKQSDVTGTMWHRFSKIVIDNPYMGRPLVSCTEQEMLQAPGKTISTNAGTLLFSFDPNEVFPLLNPETNEALGTTASGLDVHVLVYSYVMHEALKRDAPIPE